jgi:hypothetical protein
MGPYRQNPHDPIIIEKIAGVIVVTFSLGCLVVQRRPNVVTIRLANLTKNVMDKGLNGHAFALGVLTDAHLVVFYERLFE